MKTLTYSITINTPVDVVFEKITDNTVFTSWTKPWGEGMTATGAWQEGEHLVFADPSGSGTKALVEEIKPNEYIKMKHVAMIAEGDKEIEEMDEVMKKWIGAREDYFFKTNENDDTEFTVIIEADEAFEEMMEAWHEALKLFKEVCEAS